MGLFDWIGEAIGAAFHALAEFFGNVFVAVTKPIMKEMQGSGKDSIKDINAEIAAASIDPMMFNTKEFQDLVTELKERLAHSPEGVLEWFQDALGGIFKGFYDLVMTVVAPWEVKNFETAKTEAGHLMFLGLDLVILIGALDAIACACSITLIRNLCHIGRLFMSTFGFDRLAATTIQPALNAGVVPWLQYGWNNKYKAMIPGSTDLVRFALREVWDPTRRPELLKEKPGGDFYKLMGYKGFSEERCDDYWASHWVLPSVGQLNEMLHRGVIDPATWDRFVKYNDYDPTVRPWLKAISYNPYTRVDIRRMKDLELVTDTEVFKNYQDLGYDEEHARQMTIWTKAYNLSVEMRARFSKGWVNADDVLNALIEAGVPASKAKIWMQRIVYPEKEERTTKERDLTKSEIVKGVKEGVLSYEDGIALLVDMGYDEAEAEYILVVNIQALAGSPDVWSEFQEMVNLRRKSQGLQPKLIPPEVLALEKEIKTLQAKRSDLIAKNKEDPEINKLNKKIENLQNKSREIRIPKTAE